MTLRRAPRAKGPSRTNDDLTVVWGPSNTGDAMTYDVDGDCTKHILSQSIQGDPGTLTIAKGTLVSSDASQSSKTCPITITIYRSRAGSLDPAFGHGGSIIARQVRTITVTSAP